MTLLTAFVIGAVVAVNVLECIVKLAVVVIVAAITTFVLSSLANIA